MSSDASGFGLSQINPLRYRGYYYDQETGLYYLQTRYYDPKVRRFLNADDASVLTKDPEQLTEKNLYAYCDDNPVMCSKTCYPPGKSAAWKALLLLGWCSFAKFRFQCW